MPTRATLQVPDHVDVKNALVVVATPGVGLVGAIAAGYVQKRLDMPLAGGLYSPDLQANLPIVEGVGQPPFRVFALETRRAFPGSWERLVVIVSDAAPPAGAQHDVAACIAAWAKARGCRRIVVLDGVIVDREEWDDMVWGAATDAKGAEFLSKHRVQIVGQGNVGGFSGHVLNAGAAAGVESIVLMAESDPAYPDALAAARIVDVLDALLPGIAIGTDALVAEAEAVEAALRETQARLSARKAAP
jgi:uncharacterized protein